MNNFLNTLQKFVESRADTNQAEPILKPSSHWAKKMTWVMVGGTALGLVWLGTAQTEEIVVAAGKLEPKSGVIKVQMPVQGVTETVLIEEGDFVKKGQVLIKLDTEASKERKNATDKSIVAKQSELSFKLEEKEITKTQYQIRLENLETSYDLSKKILSKLIKLKEEGAAAEIQVLEQGEKVEKLRSELVLTTEESKRQLSKINQEIAIIKSELSRLQSKATEDRVILKYQEIKSPTDGVVFDLQAKTPGYVARTSDPVLKVVSLDDLQAEIEVQSKDIGFIRIGAPTEISIDSYPATDFGIIEGEVIKIGSDALPPDPALRKGYRFPAIVKLKDQFLKMRDGKRLPLQVGMSMTANIKLRKVTYLQLLLGSFKSKADSLREL